MKVTTISYKRIKNLGNYQSETVEMIAEVEKGELVETAFRDLKDQVLVALGLPTSESYIGSRAYPNNDTNDDGSSF